MVRKAIFILIMLLSVSQAVAMPRNISSDKISTIINDRGGKLATYLKRVERMQIFSEYVMIDGRCMNECTVLLALVKTNQICTTDKGQFWFQSSLMTEMPIISENGNEFADRIYTRMMRYKYKSIQDIIMMKQYPFGVQRFLIRNADLDKDYLVIPGNYIIKKC